ncbi:MAG: hypothetical protein WA687_10930 [Solirubrobacterales bacterium]
MPSQLLVFNGGGEGRTVKLLIHAFITEPAPVAVVARTTIQRKGTGLHTVSRISPIAAGMGSLVDFNFDLGSDRAYQGGAHLDAKCPDGVFKINVPKLLFRNEARVPRVGASTVMKGSLVAPCTPQG